MLNDTRNILNDPFGTELLMAACETDASAAVSWDTSRKKEPVEVRQLDGSYKLEVPPGFVRLQFFHCDHHERCRPVHGQPGCGNRPWSGALP